MREAREIGSNLERQRDRDVPTDALHDVEVELLVGARLALDVHRQHENVELERVGACRLDASGVFGPAGSGDAVHAGNDRNGDGLLRLTDQLEVALEGLLLAVEFEMVTAFGVAGR